MRKILLSGFFPDYDCGLAMATIRSYLLKDPVLTDQAEILMKGFSTETPAPEILRYYQDAAPDLLAFSCYVWNIEKTLDLCRRLRELSCRAPIVLGGPEVSYTAAEILSENPCLSAIVCGEGEETFRELAHRWLKDEGFAGVPGVVARDGDRVLENLPRAFLPDLNVIPSPYLDGSVDLKTVGTQGLGCFETYRGCVYSCSFCVWGKVRNVRYYEFERVEAELIAMMDSPIRRIWVADSVANLNKERFKKILRVILDKNKNNVFFDFEMVAELLDDELIELLGALPGGYVACGIQSTDPTALKNSQRFSDLARFRRNVETLRAKNSNVDIFLDIIYGLPGDTWRTYRKAVDYAFSFVPDKIQDHPLLVLPGTHFHQEAKRYGLVYDKRAPHYARENATFGPADFRKAAGLSGAFDLYNQLFPIRLALSILQRRGRNPRAEFDLFLSILRRRSRRLEKATVQQVLKTVDEFLRLALGAFDDSKALLPVFGDIGRYFVLVQTLQRLRLLGKGEGFTLAAERLSYDIESFSKGALLDPSLDWRSIPQKATLFCYDQSALDQEFLSVVAGQRLID